MSRQLRPFMLVTSLLLLALAVLSWPEAARAQCGPNDPNYPNCPATPTSQAPGPLYQPPTATPVASATSVPPATPLPSAIPVGPSPSPSCVSSIWFVDGDGDGFGSAAGTSEACAQPAGYVDNASDCNDADPAIHPGAADISGDAIDQDCNAACTAALVEPPSTGPSAAGSPLVPYALGGGGLLIGASLGSFFALRMKAPGPPQLKGSFALNAKTPGPPELNVREAALNAREAALNVREAALKAREAALGGPGST